MKKVFSPDNLFFNFARYKNKSLQTKRFAHSDILPLIKDLKQNNFSVDEIGRSIEDREIFLVSCGKGKTPVLLWSQMHGDESTATMALFDIFNFLSAKDEFDFIRKKILSKLKLYFIPMLNPEGAERFTRRNALNIDLNRDALRLESPESVILKTIRDKTKAEFGFNLHDQSPRYSAGINYKSAAISFLAPPANYEKEITEPRKKAMQVIAYLNEVLSKYIPGHIAKYSDDFEPRAFGDNIQRWGTGTILIESGCWPEDLEKQFIRQLNFTAILSALYSIAEKSYSQINIDSYFSIPNNEELMFDLIIRNVNIKLQNKFYKIDIGINRYERPAGENKIYYKSFIDDLGDLSIFHGYEEFNCEGMEIIEGKICETEISDQNELQKFNFIEKLKSGCTTFLLKSEIKIPDYFEMPATLTFNKNFINKIKIDEVPNFYIKDKNEIRFVIVNGFVYDLLTDTNRISNGILLQ